MKVTPWYIKVTPWYMKVNTFCWILKGRRYFQSRTHFIHWESKTENWLLKTIYSCELIVLNMKLWKCHFEYELNFRGCRCTKKLYIFFLNLPIYLFLRCFWLLLLLFAYDIAETIADFTNRTIHHPGNHLIRAFRKWLGFFFFQSLKSKPFLLKLPLL